MSELPIGPAEVVPASTCLLSIIILNYQTFELTVQTINSIDEEIAHHPGPLGYGQVEIILVDNASPDQSGSRLAEHFAGHPYLTFIQSPTNSGFSAGNELGFQAARGESIMLLNSDTVVLPESLFNLVNFLKSRQDIDRNIGVLACQLRNHDDGQLQPQGGDRPSLGTIFTQMTFIDDLPLIGQFLPSVQHTGRRQTQKGRDQALTFTGWVGGTAMVFRRSLIEKVGFLDTQIFMYGEDVEFCTRVYLKTGQKSAIYNQAPIIHYGSASSSSKNAILGEYKGYLYLWRKEKPTWQKPLLSLILWWGALFRVILFSIIKRDSTRVEIYREALSVAWQG